MVASDAGVTVCRVVIRALSQGCPRPICAGADVGRADVAVSVVTSFAGRAARCAVSQTRDALRRHPVFARAHLVRAGSGGAIEVIAQGVATNAIPRRRVDCALAIRAAVAVNSPVNDASRPRLANAPARARALVCGAGGVGLQCVAQDAARADRGVVGRTVGQRRAHPVRARAKVRHARISVQMVTSVAGGAAVRVVDRATRSGGTYHLQTL